MKPAFFIAAALGFMNLYVSFSLRQKTLGILSPSAIAVVFLFFYLLQLVAPMLDWSLAPISHRFDGAFYEELVRASYLAIGVLSCLVAFSFCVDLFWLFGRLFMPQLIQKPYQLALAGLVLGMTALSVGLGLFNAGKVEVDRVELPISGLPQAFDGVTVAQVSDIHVGPHLHVPFVETIAQKVEALHPDMIVVTGDVADGRVEKIGTDLLPLGRLTAPLGKYYVTGNHEHYWGVAGWTEKMQQLGFRALENDHAMIEKNGASIALLGVADLASLRTGGPRVTNIRQAMAGVPHDATKILLSHQPKVWEAAKEAGIVAQISGHTHAGQYFPFTMVIGLFEPHNKGLYRLNGYSLYVNRGVGFWGPPLRSSPGEISLITLRRAQ